MSTSDEKVIISLAGYCDINAFVVDVFAFLFSFMLE
jgi:hypothetical protein